MSKFIARNAERFIHSFKTALACLIGFGITQVVHFPMDQWIIITILVVMCAQINVGSIMQKSYMRFLGTLSGSLLAACMITLFGVSTVTILTTLAIAAMLFSFIATSQQKFSEAGTLGAATTTIILIGQFPTLTTALERFIEISFGIIIAAFVSQFIFPIHARVHLRKNQADTIRQLEQYYRITQLHHLHSDKQDVFKKHDELLVKNLTSQRKLAEESSREFLGSRFKKAQFNQCLLFEKEILRLSTLMHHAIHDSEATRTFFSALKFLAIFNEVVIANLEKIAQGIQKNISVTLTALPLDALKKEILTTSADYTDDQLIPLCAYLFCAELLAQQLDKLAKLWAPATTKG